MTLLFLSGCLFRGPWGLWLLHSEGEVMPLEIDDTVAVVDGSGNVYSYDDISVALGEDPEELQAWHDRIVVDGQALAVHLDFSNDVATFLELDGTVRWQVSDFNMPSTPIRAEAQDLLGLGIAADGGVVMVYLHGQEADPNLRVHREQDGSWTTTDHSLPPPPSTPGPDSIHMNMEILRVAAWGEQVALTDGDWRGLSIVDGVATDLGHYGALQGLAYDAQGRLFRLEEGGEGGNDLVVQTDTCVSRPLEELEGWIGALYTEPDGGVALLMMDDRGGAARRPVSASCEIGDPDLEWPRGYTEDPTRPLIWGDTFAFVQVYDVDPLYDHPNPTEDLYYLENAQTRNTGDTGYY